MKAFDALFIGLFASCAFAQRPSYTNASLLFSPQRSVDISARLHDGTFSADTLLQTASSDGFSFVRCDLLWSKVETSRGHYDLSFYRALVDAALPMGMSVFFTLGYGNPLYCSGLSPGLTPNCTQAFVSFAKAAVREFAGHGFLWGLYNEPNLVQSRFGGLGADLGFVTDDLGWGWTNGSTVSTPSAGGGGNITQYILVMTAVGEMFLVEFPDESLVGPGLGQIYDAQYPAGQILDSPYLNTLLLPVGSGGGGNALRYFKAVDLHVFLGDAGPEWMLNQYFQARSLIDTNAPQGLFVPIFTSAFGWSTSKPSSPPSVPGAPVVDPQGSEDMQAAYLVRSYLVQLGCGVNFTNWYEQVDKAAAPQNSSAGEEVGDHFGLRTIVGEPSEGRSKEPQTEAKLSASASQFLASSLSDASCNFVGLLELSFLPDPDPVPPCFVSYFGDCLDRDHDDDDNGRAGQPAWTFWCMVNETTTLPFSFTVDFNVTVPSGEGGGDVDAKEAQSKPWSMLPSDEDLRRLKGASLARRESRLSRSPVYPSAGASGASMGAATPTPTCYSTFNQYGQPSAAPLCVDTTVTPPRLHVNGTAFPTFVNGLV